MIWRNEWWKLIECALRQVQQAHYILVVPVLHYLTTCWLKKSGGQFVVRIEDTDLERSSKRIGSEYFESLKWLGLDADESIMDGGDYGPYRQTERLDIYKNMPINCWQKAKPTIVSAAKKKSKQNGRLPWKKGEMPMYSGKCRSLTPEQQQELLAQGKSR